MKQLQGRNRYKEKTRIQLHVMKGDITRLDFDLIVLPANTTLLPGKGLSALAFSRAGTGLLREVLQKERIRYGEAVLTSACNLPCKGIIHAAVPVCINQDEREEELLASCYWNSLSIAYSYLQDHHLDSVTLAFPSLSAGCYGFPRTQACRIAAQTVRTLMEQYPDARAIQVIFVMNEQEDYLLYKKEAEWKEALS